MTDEPNPTLEEILFELAIQKPTATERAAFLDHVCRENPALREGLDNLLAAHYGASGFLPGQPARAPAAPAPAARIPPPTARIGRYKLLEKIGEGGMGEVWMGEQEQPVRRRVALKLIKLGMDTPYARARFEAEGQALALMDHPNIARVFDVGTTEALPPGSGEAPVPASSGRPFLVMELVRGLKITEYCDQHQLSTRERLGLFVKVCQAIQHAHQKGVIHRDIKPSNILVTVNDGVPVPKVIDFGIAKALAFKLTDKTLFTEFHALVGTPAYLSPEQAELSSVDIDTRADIYSLGVLLYELLVGRTPFDAKEMLKEGLDALRQTIRGRDPVKPSTKLKTLPVADLTTTAQRRQSDPSRLVHQLRGDLDWIVLKCLEKDRARRYETANGLALDIQRHLGNEPVLARAPSVGYRLQKAWRRNRLAFAAGTAVASALIVGSGVSTWQAIRATQAQRLADQRLVEVAAERDAKERARGELEERNLDLRRAAYRTAIQTAADSLERQDYDPAQAALEQSEPELRGWEWARLNLQMPLIQRFAGPTGSSALLTRDSARVICAGTDSTLRIWDARTGEPQSVIKLPRPPNGAALSPDDQSVAIGGTDGTVSLLDLAKGTIRWEAQAHTGSIYSVAFSPDGTRLASGGFDGAVVLWSSAGQPLRTNQIAARLRGLAFSPDGRTLLVGDIELGGRLLTADGLEEICRLDALPGGRTSAAFSPDGRRFVTGDADGFVRVWDAASHQVLLKSALSHVREVGGHVVSNVSAVAFSPDGQSIASAGQDRIIRVWESGSGRLLNSFPAMTGTGWIPSLGISADGGKLLVVGRDAGTSARLWNLRHADASATVVAGHSNSIWSAAFTPDSQQIVSAGWDGWLRVSRADDGSEARALRGHTNRVIWSVAVTPDGRRAVSGAQDGTVRVWDLATAQCLRAIRAQAAPVGQPDFTLFVALSPDGQQVVAGGHDGRVQAWNLETGAPLWAATNRTERIWSMAWSPDGRWIAAGRAGGRLTLLDARLGSERWHTNFGQAYLVSVAFRPGSRQILTGDLAGELHLCDTESGRLVREIPVSREGIRAAVFSPDGRRMVSAGDDGIVRLWDSESGDLVFRLPREPARVSALAFSPDGRRLFIGRTDGQGRVWQTEAPAPKP